MTPPRTTIETNAFRVADLIVKYEGIARLDDHEDHVALNPCDVSLAARMLKKETERRLAAEKQLEEERRSHDATLQEFDKVLEENLVTLAELDKEREAHRKMMGGKGLAAARRRYEESESRLERLRGKIVELVGQTKKIAAFEDFVEKEMPRKIASIEAERAGFVQERKAHATELAKERKWRVQEKTRAEAAIAEERQMRLLAEAKLAALQASVYAL
ncbi:hypothetical protein Q8F55_009246 [Vanrija albida]|uniref:DUF4200 domain-containing protein n=1 Tax=Vanrija albida TaxID=181172 RepID=A0ABR3PU05_9TREE